MSYYCSVPLIVCLLSFQVLADDDGKAPPTNQKSNDTAEFQFDGVWKPKGAMLGGVLLPPPVLETITLKIEKDNYEVTVIGEDHSDKGTFKLDETVAPKRMTIKSESGPNKGKTFLAIYEIKGVNAMRVCYDLSGKEFPKEFKAPKGSELYLVGYRRQESKATDASEDVDRTKLETDAESAE